MARMYIHAYVDAFGITQVLFSGSANNTSGFMDKTAFNPAILAIKSVPAGKRSFDPDTKIWYIDNEYWQQTRNFFLVGKSIYELIEHPTEDNFNEVLTGTKHTPPSWTGPDNKAAADFFHNFKNDITKIANESDEKKLLAELLGLDSFEQIPSDKAAVKKLYRAATIKHHPDKNMGDGTKMSDLNMLWRIYVQPTL